MSRRFARFMGTAVLALGSGIPTAWAGCQPTPTGFPSEPGSTGLFELDWLDALSRLDDDDVLVLLTEEPCKLDPITVTPPPGHGGGGVGGGPPPGGSGGSGGGGGEPGGGGVSGGNVPNAPNNPTPATCESDPVTREAHAQEDGRYLRAQLFPNVPSVGSIWTVEYDDGGTEQWVWTGMSAPFGHPIQGSLTCP